MYVGDLIRVLEENGLDKNTLVIFTADNGAATYGGPDPDYFKCSGDLRGRKGSLYEGGVKVPFIAYWPGVIKPNTASDHISAIWDLMPTFLGVAGSNNSKGIDGISFLPTLKQEENQQKKHKFLYWERHNNAKHSQAVRFGDWKAVKDVNESKIALFNLKQDPFERKNVADKYPDLIAKAESYIATRRVAVIPEWNFVEPTEDF
jgi:arylsulfatase A